MPFAILAGIELGPLLAALGALLLVGAAFLLKSGLRAMADEIPVIGGYIARGLEAAAGKLIGWANDALNAAAQPLIALLHGTGVALHDLAIQTASFAGTLADSLDRLVTETIPNLIEVAAVPVVQLIGAVNGELAKVYGWAAQTFTAVQAEVVTLEHDLVGEVHPAINAIVHTALPAVQREIGAVAGEIESVVLPGIKGLENWDATVWPVIAGAAVGVAELAWFRMPDSQSCLKTTCNRLPDILSLLEGAESAALMESILARAGLSPDSVLTFLDSGFGMLSATF